MEGIVCHYGIESFDEWPECPEIVQDLNDSVQPGFCLSCGEYSHDVETVAHGDICELCGASGVNSLTAILVGI